MNDVDCALLIIGESDFHSCRVGICRRGIFVGGIVFVMIVMMVVRVVVMGMVMKMIVVMFVKMMVMVVVRIVVEIVKIYCVLSH